LGKLVLLAGTRGSDLAIAQTQSVIGLLLQRNNMIRRVDLSIETKIIKTSGDDLYRRKIVSQKKLTGKDSFTREIDRALIRGDIDFAVHSLKDVPVFENDSSQIQIAAFPKRESPNDVLISKNPKIKKIEDLNKNAVVGTSSLRRGIQLKVIRPDLEIAELHGNVPTRIEIMQRNGRKSNLDAIVLAEAGLKRLGIKYNARSVIPTEEMLPAVGQGCLAIAVRSSDSRTKRIISSIDDAKTRLCVITERSFSKELGGGCNTPIAALATIDRSSRKEEKMTLVGLVAGRSKTGESEISSNFVIKDMIQGKPNEGKKLGVILARKLKAVLK
jgi:hydroxymethylbilane synthase